jgi:hypothetical protein
MMNLMDTALIIPGLLPEIPDADIGRLPHLERLLARGTFTPLSGAIPAAKLQTGSRSDTPLRADSESRLGPGPNTENAGGCHSLAKERAQQAGLLEAAPYWLCADPIHLQVQGDTLLLLEQYSFALTQPEADALIETLNAHFVPEGLRFYAPSPHAWLVGMQNPATLTTTAPLKRVGRSIDGYLPQGDDAQRWRSYFNEAQMLFHEHAVNVLREGQRVVRNKEQREMQRERLISGVWFWDEPFAPPHPGTQMINTLRKPSAYGDAEAWNSAATALDQEVIAPLLQQLAKGQIHSITLLVPEGRSSARITLTRWQLWQLWRRPRPLYTLPGVSALTHA